MIQSFVDFLYTLSISEFIQNFIILFLFISSIFFWIRLTSSKYVTGEVDVTPQIKTILLEDPNKPIYSINDISYFNKSLATLDILTTDTPSSKNYTLYI
jgi:hypothetical protein